MLCTIRTRETVIKICILYYLTHLHSMRHSERVSGEVNCYIVDSCFNRSIKVNTANKGDGVIWILSLTHTQSHKTESR